MTVSATTSEISYTGNGVADEFAFPFLIFDAANLVVTEIDDEGTETTLVLDTDYTVDGVGIEGQGSVALAAPLADGYTLVIESILARTQAFDVRNEGAFIRENHEQAYDKVTRLVQELNNRGPDLPLYTSETRPAASPRYQGKRILVRDASSPMMEQLCIQNADDTWDWQTVAVGNL